jgi:hypothetical protein
VRRVVDGSGSSGGIVLFSHTVEINSLAISIISDSEEFFHNPRE